MSTPPPLRSTVRVSAHHALYSIMAATPERARPELMRRLCTLGVAALRRQHPEATSIEALLAELGLAANIGLPPRATQPHPVPPPPPAAQPQTSTSTEESAGSQPAAPVLSDIVNSQAPARRESGAMLAARFLSTHTLSGGTSR